MSKEFGLNEGIECIRSDKDPVLLLNTLKRLPQLVMEAVGSDAAENRTLVISICQQLLKAASAPETNDEMLFAICDTIPTFLSVFTTPEDTEAAVCVFSQVVAQESIATVAHMLAVFDSKDIVLVKDLPHSISEPSTKKRKANSSKPQEVFITYEVFGGFVARLCAVHQRVPCRVLGTRLLPVLARIEISDPEAIAKLLNPQLYDDQTGVVKKAAMQALPELLRNDRIQPLIKDKLYENINMFMFDGSPGVRQYFCPVLSVMHEIGAIKQQELVSCLEKLVYDENWRVRCASLDALSSLVSESSPGEEELPNIISIYDSAKSAIQEREVLATIARNITHLAQCLNPSQNAVCTKVAAIASTLASDTTDAVRTEMAKGLPNLIVALEKLDPDSKVPSLQNLKSNVLPHLITDESSEVRMALLSALRANSESASVLRKAFFICASSQEWLVRLSAAESALTIIALNENPQKDENFVETCLSLLDDDAASVRLSAIKVVENLGSKGTLEWIENELFPAIVRRLKQNRYHGRITAIDTLVAIIGFCSKTTQNTALEDILDAAAHDAIPNVRLVAAAACAKIASALGKDVVGDRIKSVLEVVAAVDEDKDVRDSAAKALSSLS